MQGGTDDEFPCVMTAFGLRSRENFGDGEWDLVDMV